MSSNETTKSQLIPTLNAMGYMTLRPDEISEQFVSHRVDHHYPPRLLDVGSAFGVATLEALQKGASVVANDLDERHLVELKNKWTGEPSRLSLLSGDIRAIDLPDNHFDGILCARILHFFHGEEVLAVLQKLKKALKPGGKLFVVMESPFLKNWATFFPTYLENKQKGERWPCLITNVKAHEKIRSHQLPELLHFFDLETLQDALTSVGFHIQESKYLNRTDFPDDVRLDGRESVGAIAVKIA